LSTVTFGLADLQTAILVELAELAVLDEIRVGAGSLVSAARRAGPVAAPERDPLARIARVGAADPEVVPFALAPHVEKRGILHPLAAHAGPVAASLGAHVL